MKRIIFIFIIVLSAVNVSAQAPFSANDLIMSKSEYLSCENPITILRSRSEVKKILTAIGFTHRYVKGSTGANWNGDEDKKYHYLTYTKEKYTVTYDHSCGYLVIAFPNDAERDRFFQQFKQLYPSLAYDSTIKCYTCDTAGYFSVSLEAGNKLSISSWNAD